jgi:hypothetical protein
MKPWWPVVVPLFALASYAAPAEAQCMVSMPGCDSGRPTGLLATFACVCDVPGVCNIGEFCSGDPVGAPCPDLGMNATCESRMWHLRNDNSCIPTQSAGLSPATDCSPGIETFAPTCPLTFTVLSRGTAQFRNVFGWYEVTGARPAPEDLHVMLDCDTAPGETAVLDVRSDPSYGGGEVGFFLLTPEGRAGMGGTAACAGGDCCASLARYARGEGFLYFSERAFSDDGSVTHLNVYDSAVFERKFYFAWEDTFGRSNFDFTDLVTSVEGVECAGAGERCDTGMMGACGVGTTRCERGTLTCTPVITAEAEVCNGVDDDCDGTPDDGATCGAREVCDQGRCVPNCELSDEFVCDVGFECVASTGFCVETACIGVTCDAGEVCRRGTCAGECEGVVCPHGQQCFRDRCIDPCRSVTCGAGEICRGGLCVPGCGRCDGVACGGGLVCATPGGECSDPSCAGGCGAGTFCRAGTCVDACEGASCPRGAACVAGECVVPEGADAGFGPGFDGGPVDASTNLDGGRARTYRDGCGCRVAGGGGSGPLGGGLAVLALFGLAFFGRAVARAARRRAC